MGLYYLSLCPFFALAAFMKFSESFHSPCRYNSNCKDSKKAVLHVCNNLFISLSYTHKVLIRIIFPIFIT